MKSRKRNPYRVWQSVRTGRWHAAVYVRGRRTEVGGPAFRPARFSSPEAARRAARTFAARLIGGPLYGNAALWRADG